MGAMAVRKRATTESAARNESAISDACGENEVDFGHFFNLRESEEVYRSKSTTQVQFKIPRDRQASDGN